MLEKIKPILAYAEWLALVVFCAIFGWTIHSRTLIGAMICYLLSALLIWIIFKLRSKKLSSVAKIAIDKYWGNPVLDIFLIAIGFQAYINSQVWMSLGLAGLFLVGIDLIRWGISLLNK